jgi:ATP-binding cassette subfamily G (WHITE) protein 2 (PDR)
VSSTGVNNPFDYEEGSDLDPYSSNFSARKYVRSLATLGKGSERLSGIAFKNLSVSGLQSDADYQKTVGNYPLALLGALRDAMSNRKRKVPIIEGLDGVLEAGEMLVVLGPPGSGCSTLLKSIAGEYNGLYLDENSEINYRGTLQ